MRSLSSRSLALAAAAAAVAGLLAACGSSPSPAELAITTHPPTATWTTRLILRQTTVRAGTTISGVLIVTYRGRAPVNLAHRCGPLFGVALTNHRFPPEIGFPGACRVGPFIIRPGVNRLALAVPTTFEGCSHAASMATSRIPACLHGQVPPLPPGRYRAVLVGYEFPVPAPAPVPVSLSGPG